MRNLWLAAAIVVLGPGLCAAQDGQPAPSSVVFPGSVGGAIGTLAPSEPGNVISQMAIEQGVSPWHRGSLFLVGFARVSPGRDTEGLAWNNRTPTMFGARLTKVMQTGVLQLNVGAALAGDTAGSSKLTRVAFGSYWAGWRGVRGGSHEVFDAFPGSISAISGIITPLEPDNWITSTMVDQGVTVYRRHRSTIIPFTRFAASVDTERYSWNNRTSIEGGAKLRQDVRGGIIDVGVSHRLQYDRVTRQFRNAPVVFVEMWIGWNPHLTRR